MNKTELCNLLREKYPNSNIFDIFSMLDRRDFLPGANTIDAYSDKQVSIGCFQHSLAPSTIIEMLQFLKLEDNQNILEIGTGSGYLTACMYKQGSPNQIITIERDKRLCGLAKHNLKEKLSSAIEQKRIRIFWENGLHASENLPKYSFDRIVFTCATDIKKIKHFNFQDLLANNGTLVFPVAINNNKSKLVSYALDENNELILSEEKEIPHHFDEIKSGREHS